MTDNCSGQNKNWCFFNDLTQYVHTWGPETITIKYREKGHIFMAAGAIHFILENYFARHALLPRPTAWKSERQHKTIVLDLPFMYLISKKASIRSSPKLKCLLWKLKLRSNSTKGSSMMHYKEYFLEESYTTINFLQPSFLKKDGLKTFPAPSTQRRGITQSTRGNIVNTPKGVPQSAHSFWKSIYYNNTFPDLRCSTDVLEEVEC